MVGCINMSLNLNIITVDNKRNVHSESQCNVKSVSIKGKKLLCLIRFVKLPARFIVVM